MEKLDKKARLQTIRKIVSMNSLESKLVVKNPLDCSLCRSCMEDAGEGKVTVEGDDTNFFFKFETDGSLSAKQVLDKAAEILSQEAKAFADDVAAL